MSITQKIPFKLLAFLFSMALLLGLVMPLFTLSATGSPDDAEQMNFIDTVGTAGGMVFGAKEDGDYIDFVEIVKEVQSQTADAGKANGFAAAGLVFLLLTPVCTIAGAALLLARKKKLAPVLCSLGGLLSLVLTQTFFALSASAARAGGSTVGYSADSGFWVSIACLVLALLSMLLYRPSLASETGESAAKKAINAQRLTESAILIALGTVLSELKVIAVPFGGGITICAMVPMILLAYRWGMKWGFFTSFVFGVFQMLLGIAKHSFGFDLWIVILDILLEYILAYTLLALGGVFRNRFKNPVAALTLGGALAVFSRYLVHFAAGFLFWGSYAEWFFTDGAGVSIGNVIMGNFQGAGLAVVYSGIVNGSLMLGEMVITVVALAIIGKFPQLSKKKA